MGERLNGGSVDSKVRVEEVGKADAIGLRGQTDAVSICAKAPRQALLHQLPFGFVAAHNKALVKVTAAALTCDCDYIIAVPLYVDDLYDFTAPCSAN
jgi:hypothetical protein